MNRSLFYEASMMAIALVLIGRVAASITPGISATKATATEVRHVLTVLPFYTVFDNLDCRVDGDTATLLGTVIRPDLKRDAEKATMRVEGVNHVINRIEVLPPSASDGKLRLAEYLAIYGDALLSQYQYQAIPPIRIIVKNGAVTLEGSVANQTEKTEAFQLASAVPGVSSLTNHLRIGQ